MWQSKESLDEFSGTSSCPVERNLAIEGHARPTFNWSGARAVIANMLVGLNADCLFSICSFLSLDDVFSTSECSRAVAGRLASQDVQGIWRRFRPGDRSSAITLICEQSTVRRAQATYEMFGKTSQIFDIFQIAAANDRLDIVKWAAARMDFASHTVISVVVFRALHKNKLAVAKWIVRNLRDHIGSHRVLFRDACARGFLGAAQWLADELRITATDARASQEYAFRHACANGHLDVAVWLADTFECDARVREFATLTDACRGGHLDVVDWLARRFEPSAAHVAAALTCACGEGRIDVVRRLAELFPTCHAGLDLAGVMQGACASGFTDIVMWLMLPENRMMARPGVAPSVVYRGLAAACAGNHVELMTWLMANHAPPTDADEQRQILVSACAGGRFECVDALVTYFGARQLHISTDASIAMFVLACRHGSLDIAQWVLRRSGIDLARAPEVCGAMALAATEAGHCAVVAWMLDESPLAAPAASAVFQLACARGYFTIARLVANRCEVDVMADDNIAMRAAVQCGHFDIVDWLTDTYGVPCDGRRVAGLESPSLLATGYQSDVDSMLGDLDDAPAPKPEAPRDGGAHETRRAAMARIFAEDDEGAESDEGAAELDAQMRTTAEDFAEPDGNIAALLDI